MDLDHIGEHCNLSTCKQLDYLPFTCNYCNEKYCLDHFKPNFHNCKNYKEVDIKVNECPVCSKVIPIERGQSAETSLKNHILRNCNDVEQMKINKRCSLKSCKQKTIVIQNCSECDMNYCMKHRFPEAHNCDRMHAGDRMLVSLLAYIKDNSIIFIVIFIIVLLALVAMHK